MSPRSHPARRVAVTVAATAALLVVVTLAGPELGVGLREVRDGSWASASFEDLLARVCAVAAVAAGCCWWAGVLRLVAAAGSGLDAAHLPAPVGVPTWLRRAVLAACGVALVVGPSTPALADDSGADPATDPVAALALPAATGDLPGTGPGGLPLPDRVAGEAPRSPARPGPRAPLPRSASTPPAAPATATVRVQPGDSLWTIAEAQLRAAGHPVDDAAVATRWQEIYARNTERIGPDPDLVLPGQQLDLDRP